MSLQHREFVTQLRDAERLRLYVKSGLFARESLDACLQEAQLTTRRWELEVKEATDKVAQAEAERDVARLETVMALLETESAGSAQAQVELELSRV